MGASAWHHFGPYANNLVLSFEVLCQNVFEARDFHKSDEYAAPTIQSLLEEQGINGTHSILDYMHSGYSYQIQLPERSVDQYLRPISDQGLQAVFGTVRPSRQMIEDKLDALWEYVLEDREQIEGNYIIIDIIGKL